MLKKYIKENLGFSWLLDTIAMVERWKIKNWGSKPLVFFTFWVKTQGRTLQIALQHKKKKLEASSFEWPLLMKKTLGSSTPTSFSNPQRNFGAPSLEFSLKAQSKLEAKHPTHSQQKKNPRLQGLGFSLLFKM